MTMKTIRGYVSKKVLDERGFEIGVVPPVVYATKFANSVYVEITVTEKPEPKEKTNKEEK